MDTSIEKALIKDLPHHHALESDMGCCTDCCPSCTDCCPGCPSCPDCCPSCPSCTDCCPGCPGCTTCCPGCTDCCPNCPSCKSCCSCCCSAWKSVICCLPKLLCHLPKLPGCPLHIKRLLIVVVVIVLIVVVVLGALLLGLHVTQEHTENVLQMTMERLEGEVSWLQFMDWEEEVVTLYADAGTGNPGMVVYDNRNLLIGYRSWQGQACYISRMDKENVPGLTTVAKAFHQHLQGEEKRGFPVPLADHSILGTTFNILCSNISIYWTSKALGGSVKDGASPAMASTGVPTDGEHYAQPAPQPWLH
ncbi:surfactant protein C-like isoform X2 [Carettochelys insculpta]|uniref:surfactant protein C-like isoform X2 n=1 Tax=Carettochelys insculpta TaxID=44489 RepID=UPI003EBF0A7C